MLVFRPVSAGAKLRALHDQHEGWHAGTGEFLGQGARIPRPNPRRGAIPKLARRALLVFRPTPRVVDTHSQKSAPLGQQYTRPIPRLRRESFNAPPKGGRRQTSATKERFAQNRQTGIHRPGDDGIPAARDNIVSQRGSSRASPRTSSKCRRQSPGVAGVYELVKKGLERLKSLTTSCPSSTLVIRSADQKRPRISKYVKLMAIIADPCVLIAAYVRVVSYGYSSKLCGRKSELYTLGSFKNNPGPPRWTSCWSSSYIATDRRMTTPDGPPPDSLYLYSDAAGKEFWRTRSKKKEADITAGARQAPAADRLLLSA